MYDVPVAVKDALRSGAYRKNYRFLVLNDDGTTDFTIDNDNLVSESVSIDERMCSGDTLKFGLCEGSSLEFQYFGKANITGRRVQTFIDAHYIGNSKSLTDNDATYTFQKAGDYQVYVPANTNKFTVRVKQGQTTMTWVVSYSAQERLFTYWCQNMNVGNTISIESEYPFNLTLSRIDGADFETWQSIPMGYFDVKSCSRQASTGIIRASCYNKLMSDYLDANASAEIKAAINGSPAIVPSLSVFKILDELLNNYSIRIFNGTKYVPEHTSLIQLYLSQSYTTRYGGDYFRIFNYSVHYNVPSTPSNTIFIYQLEKLQEKIHSVFTDNIRNSSGQRLYDNSSIGIIGASYCVSDTHEYKTISRLTSASMTYYESDVFSDITEFVIKIPFAYEYSADMINRTVSATEWQNNFEPIISSWLEDIAETEDLVTYWEVDASSMETMRLYESDISDNVTLRQLQTSVYEMQCMYGQLDRATDLFSGVELNHSRLLPTDTLYPSDSLHPDGAQESAFRSQYSKLWADEGNVRKWRYLIITYKGLDENQQEKEFTLQRTVNADGTDDYNMSDNWLFKNLVWTEAQIIEYATAMVAKMQDITWFPFEMWAPGLPYLETGDEIEIPLGENTYTSYILERQLRGIQNLQDTYINGTLDIF